MREEEYDIMKLNPRKNPYAKITKKQVTINPDEKITEHAERHVKLPIVPERAH